MPNIGKINYDVLPEHMREGMKLYVDKGIATGGFMNAVLRNELVAAYATADLINTMCMKDFAQFLYMEAPTASWGSKAKVKAWKKAGGAIGQGLVEV